MSKKENNKNENKQKILDIETIPTTFQTSGKVIIQEIYRPQTTEYLFAVYDQDQNPKVTYRENIQLQGKTYTPVKSPLIEKKIVLLPSGIEEYNSTSELIEQIKSFIHRYYEYPQIFEEFDAYFVLHTWNYDKFSVTPYRRILGDYGCGKTRYLEVLGNICYLSTFISSASSEASIYRMIDIFHGTVVIDEGDFIRSNLYATIVKILNSGYKKGTPVVKINLDTYEPQAFEVFCPKIISTRQRYADQALESRCITHEADILTRNDIPTVLSDGFYKETESLRNKLLLYKFRNCLNNIQEDKEFEALKIEPRIKEVLLPLASIIDNPEIKKRLIDFANEYQRTIIRERGLGLAKIILGEIIILYTKNVPLAVGFIASEIEEKFKINLSARRCGAIISKDLRLLKERKQVGDNVPIVVIWDEEKIKRLCIKYDLDFNNLMSLTYSGDDTPIKGFIPSEDNTENNTPV
jgi:hypothetical protein